MDDLGDLGALLQPLLDNPEAMSKLRRQAEQMGLGGMLPPDSDIPHPAPEPPPSSGTANTSSRDAADERTTDSPSGDGGGFGGISPDMLEMITRFAPLLSGMSREDDSARLLKALKPFLSEERSRRADEAGKLLSVMRVVSMLPDISKK